MRRECKIERKLVRHNRDKKSVFLRTTLRDGFFGFGEFAVERGEGDAEEFGGFFFVARWLGRWRGLGKRLPGRAGMF